MLFVEVETIMMKQTTLTQIYPKRSNTSTINNSDMSSSSSDSDSEVSETSSTTSANSTSVSEKTTIPAVKDDKNVIETPKKPITGVATISDQKGEASKAKPISSRNMIRQGDLCTVIIGTKGDKVKATFPALKLESGLDN